MAHIVAESPAGPRGDSPLLPSERNRATNLILLCNIHHQLVDDQPKTYSGERLLRMKAEHAAWVATALGLGVTIPDIVPPNVTATLHSTILRVQEMPKHIYSVPCAHTREQDVSQLLRPLRWTGNCPEMAPFILRAGNLFAFQNLNDGQNPFANLVQGQSAKRHLVRDWQNDPDKMGWYTTLANRSLNKLTGRRGLHLDKDHRRFYFAPDEPGQEKEVSYRPPNQQHATRKVVWQPLSKQTGEGRGYWLHRAVALRFLQVAQGRWCLTLRPEFRVTGDGVTPLRSERIGAQVTRKKSHMFNDVLLGEVQFWRDFLSDSTPRIVLPLGPSQRIVISSTLAASQITWPGLPEEHAKPFRNAEYSDDLFSLANLAELATEGEDDDEEDDDEDAFG